MSLLYVKFQQRMSQCQVCHVCLTQVSILILIVYTKIEISDLNGLTLSVYLS